MRSPVVELLADVSKLADQLKFDWYLFGAQAALLHGAARLTADVDVTVRLREGVSVHALTNAFNEGRFRSRTSDPTFAERTRLIPAVHTPTELPLDVIIAGSGIEDVFFTRVIERVVDGVRVKLASAEDIVIMKVLAARAKDLDDIVSIAAAYGPKLDVAYIDQTLNQLEAALAQSDLLPAWRTAMDRARRVQPST